MGDHSWKKALAAAVALAGLALTAASAPSPKPTQKDWEVLEPGLELGVFLSPRASAASDSKIRALQEDLRTSISLMRTRGHVNNSRLTKDKAVLAFDATGPGAPPVKIIDRGCEDFAAWKDRYATLVQSIRMISCDRKNVWSRQPVQWSIAAIGMDRQGRVLFLHSRSPYSPHDLIDILLALPLDLASAMYVEGGPEAQLFVHSGKRETELVGSFETGFFESDANDHAWPVPNVIGVIRK